MKEIKDFVITTTDNTGNINYTNYADTGIILTNTRNNSSFNYITFEQSMFIETIQEIYKTLLDSMSYDAAADRASEAVVKFTKNDVNYIRLLGIIEAQLKYYMHGKGEFRG